MNCWALRSVLLNSSRGVKASDASVTIIDRIAITINSSISTRPGCAGPRAGTGPGLRRGKAGPDLVGVGAEHIRIVPLAPLLAVGSVADDHEGLAALRAQLIHELIVPGVFGHLRRL